MKLNDVKSMYEILSRLDKNIMLVIQTHTMSGQVWSYAYRWTNDSWADWFNWEDDNGIPDKEFWIVMNGYNAIEYEHKTELDGVTCSILHVYEKSEG